jgi:quercetin dioxygenase-like cupin family protein
MDCVRTGQKAREEMTQADWGTLTWMASPQVGNAEGLTVGRCVIRPGQENPRHQHTTCEEVLFVLSGKVEHTLGGESVILEAGDTIVVPRGVFHNARSIGDTDADMIVVFNSGNRDFVKETD